MTALEKALGDLLDAPKRCAAMGEAGRERIESVFAWHVVSEQYRELWNELEERRASARQNGDVHPWPMAHTARLFAAHASAPPSAGPWWLAEQGSDPILLTDSHADLLSAAADADQFPSELADNLKTKRQEGGQWLETNDLEKLYCHCGIPAHQWNRTHQPA